MNYIYRFSLGLLFGLLLIAHSKIHRDGVLSPLKIRFSAYCSLAGDRISVSPRGSLNALMRLGTARRALGTPHRGYWNHLERAKRSWSAQSANGTPLGSWNRASGSIWNGPPLRGVRGGPSVVRGVWNSSFLSAGPLMLSSLKK